MRSLTAAIAFAAALAPALPARAAHDRAYWKSIVDHQYAVPEGADPVALERELTDLFGSPDPVLRDEYAYSITEAWVYRKKVFQPDDLRGFIKAWTANLTNGETVYRRSFSALALSVVAALDNAQPFLRQDEFDDLLGRALAYLKAERDLRGFDPKIGWIHATAHTADVLKFLARSKNLQPQQQRQILDGLSTRLATADVAFTRGEDERLARVCTSLLVRPDFDLNSFRDWLQHIEVPAFAENDPVLNRRENVRHFLASLLLLLGDDPRFPDARAAIVATARRLS